MPASKKQGRTSWIGHKDKAEIAYTIPFIMLDGVEPLPLRSIIHLQKLAEPVENFHVAKLAKLGHRRPRITRGEASPLSPRRVSASEHQSRRSQHRQSALLVNCTLSHELMRTVQMSDR
eukprot:scaffold278858_cov37-Tisochrysis_lutea.AAC.1